MNVVKVCLFLLVIFIFAEFHECGRTSSRGRPRPGLSTPRPRITTPRHYSTGRTTPRYSNTGYSTPRQHSSTRYTTPRSNYVGSTRRSGFDSLPPRPGSKDYNPQGPHTVVYNVKNKYVSYPGQYHLPVQSSYPGYYHAPSYHYSSSDVGSTALGLFIGYSLAKLTTPTYSHYSFYDGYRPRYDHYTVHHYYHDKDSVQKNQEIQANAIVGCVGDSTTVCPANTTSLCTSNGALMCVVSATSTVPCTDIRQVNCIKSTISCVNNTAPECKNGKSTTISIPCISNAKIYGDLKYENNTIVVNNSTVTNSSTIADNVTSTAPQYSTKYPITTTPTAVVTTLTSNGSVRRKREIAKEFCVTIIALPAEKPPTEGEKAFDDAKNIVSNFIEHAWGLS